MKLTVSLSPHLRAKDTTMSIMRDVLIALSPAAIFAVYRFGAWAGVLMFIAVISAIAFEAVYCKIIKKSITVNDLSAAVTGLLIAFNLPASAPWWMPIVGSAFAIIIVKQLFGGIGCNFLNPALAARAFLVISWPVRMADYSIGASAITGATPLVNPEGINHLSLFMGEIGGAIGEVSKILLLAGALYLVVRKVITLWIPASIIITIMLCSFVTGLLLPEYSGSILADPIYQTLSGGLILGSFFMATDYSTSPITKNGKIIFGVLIGLIIYLIRTFGSYPEGTSFAILIMNLAVPLLDKLLKPKAFGRT